MTFCYPQTKSCILIFMVAVEFFSVGDSQSDEIAAASSESSSLLPIPLIPGCRIKHNDAGTGYTVFCNKFDYNESSPFLPIETRRLQIYQSNNLIIDIPLCSHLEYLEILELPRNNLHNISKEMLLGLNNLRVIKLSNNYLRSLPEDAFIYNKKLEAINLSENFFLSIQLATRAINGLLFLEELDMSRNILLDTITPMSFSLLRNSNLQRLDISQCFITKIEKGSFLPVKNITYLNLSDNPFSQTALVNLTFSFGKNNGLENIRDLRMNGLRDIRFVPLSFFKNLNGSNVENLELAENTFFNFFILYFYYPKLERLDLSSCSQVFDEQFNVSNNMPALKTLILKEVGFSKIRDQFLFLPNLETLILSSPFSGANQVISINEYSFRNLHNLEKLHLTKLGIQQALTKNILHGLEHLIELRTDYNWIKTIEDFAFDNMKSLDILDLSANKIEHLTNNTFYGLQNVTILDLGRNNIVFFNSTSPFQHMHRLQVLHLSRNRLFQLPSDIFWGLHDAVVIRLDQNFIVPWQEKLLSRLENVTIFTVSSNKLAYFTTAMLEDVEQVKYLDFSRNSLNCSFCETQSLQTWLKNQNFTVVQNFEMNDSEYYSCRYPASLEGQHIAMVNLSLNAHCYPVYVDVLMISYCAISPILGIAILVIIIWYKWKWNLRYLCFHVRLSVKKYREQTHANDYEFDAFVSYCEADYTWVWDHLVLELEMKDPKFRLCFPERDFVAGNFEANTTMSAIEGSRCTILVLSNKAMESDWCEFAMDMAQHQVFEETRNGLILVLLQSIEASLKTKNLKYVLRTRTVIVFPDNPVGQKLFWERLRFAISRPDEKVLSKHIT